MDGLHDMGGREGFGPVVNKKQPFSDDWEIRVNALMGHLLKRRVFNMDEYRHAIERMEPRQYVGASYFGRVFTAVATLSVEKGLITREELDAALGERVPLSRPSQSGRTFEGTLPELAIGDRVTVKAEFVPGHIRLPAYIRGKTGTVVGVSPAYPFPDAAAHGLESTRQRTFDVRFRSSDLWPGGCEEADVHVGVFHAYLSKCE